MGRYTQPLGSHVSKRRFAADFPSRPKIVGERIDMSTSIRRTLGVVASLGAAAILAGAPLVFGIQGTYGPSHASETIYGPPVPTGYSHSAPSAALPAVQSLSIERPYLAPADTPVANAGIEVNAQDPSDYIHLIYATNPDPTNHQLSPHHTQGTADFVIFLSGISNNDGDNFTAPITASWTTQGNGSTSSFVPSSGTVTFENKYVPHYVIVKVPFNFDVKLFAKKWDSYASFNFIITSATNASIGRGTATEYVIKGYNGPTLAP
jgi:hypothetical protein